MTDKYPPEVQELIGSSFAVAAYMKTARKEPLLRCDKRFLSAVDKFRPKKPKRMIMVVWDDYPTRDQGYAVELDDEVKQALAAAGIEVEG